MVDQPAPLPRPAGARMATLAGGLACLVLAGVLGLQQRDESRLEAAAAQAAVGDYQHAAASAGRVRRAPALGQALLVRAHAEVELRRYPAAVTDFRAASARDPKSWTIHADLAAALLAAGQVEAATREYRTALDLNPMQ